MAQVVTSERKRTSAAKRSPFQIMMDVLTVVTEGCTRPTQIMYRSNTSWIMLQKILDSMVASGLLRQHAERTRLEYVATEKGFGVARQYLDLVHATEAQPTSVL